MKPQVLEGKRLLIAAHSNTLRSLIKHFDKLSDRKLPSRSAHGAPLVYRFDDSLAVIEKFYLE